MMATPPVLSEALPSPSEPRKTTSSVRNVHADQPPFGSRYLTPDTDVWSKNAWDHVPPPDDQHDRIASSLARQHAKPVQGEEKARYNEKPAKHWDNFYKMNADNFFRNRKWLHTEFSELVAATQTDAGPITIAELGCGAGNSVFPLLASNQNPDLKLFAFDYSSHAVKLVQQNELYLSPPVGSIQASVWDLTSTSGLPDGVAPSSVDIIILIFVLSALHPDEWSRAVSNIHRMLKPGGVAVLRDYGRYDLTQLRFKEGRLLEDNFYVRGDKTRVYFFELDELAILFTGSRAMPRDKVPSVPQIVYDDEEGSQNSTSLGINPSRTSPPSSKHTPTAEKSEPSPSFFSESSTATTLPLVNAEATTQPPVLANSSSSILQPARPPLISSEPKDVVHPAVYRAPPDCPAHPLFSVEQLGVDRRLLVNRKRQLKMYRVWMQGKFRKLRLPDAEPVQAQSENGEREVAGER